MQLFLVVWLFALCDLSFAQSPEEKLVHSTDVSVSDKSVEMVDSTKFEGWSSADLEPMFMDSITSNEVIQRAYQMASVRWTPLKPVPKRGNSYYSANKTATGVPYSSVKELNTYLFQDVSYYTFMTAVHNPESVLYSENISQPPYCGTNCATYYGAVCSSSVAWVLGIDIPYSSSSIIKLPDIKKLEYQIVDSLKICDILWKSGHVQMIYDVKYREDTLYRISTFETSGTNAHIRNYSKKQFLNMWNAGGYVGYRYNKVIYSTEPLSLQEWDSIIYNDYLCPSKGDKAVYRSTDTITINIFDSTYYQIVLSKDTTLVASDEYTGNIHQYYELQPGIYTVFLQREAERTASVSFEVVTTNVSYSWSDDGKNLIVYFDSSAKPKYAALCNSTGASRYYPLSEIDRKRGFITIPQSKNSTLRYCKVIFKGEYGSIINVPILVE
jgi:hypothetical protein